MVIWRASILFEVRRNLHQFYVEGTRVLTGGNTTQHSFSELPETGNSGSDYPMLYRNRLFKRDQLTLLRGVILQKAWAFLACKPPFLNIHQNPTVPKAEDITSRLFKQALNELGMQP
jgi:hypothetical protein